jgi:ABC-2 type transport system ATP-binding protein
MLAHAGAPGELGGLPPPVPPGQSSGPIPEKPATPDVLELSGVTVRYGAFTAVDQVGLRVRQGEVFGLLGPNGSGKTTLLRAMCGLVPLAAGSARVLGHQVPRDTDRIRAAIGYMSQKFALYEDLKARENLSFYAGVYGLFGRAARERKSELVARLHLEPYLERRAGQLSGGWKQRLALACALLHRPRLVFLDEPTAGIDPAARWELWDLLFDLAGEGLTLFVTTHYMDEVERCNRVGYLHRGQLLAAGTPAELKALPLVTPSGARWVEITGPDVVGLIRTLRQNRGVREATAFGQVAHALVEGDWSATDFGLSGDQVRVIKPGLEDVFVTLTRAAGRMRDEG